MGAVAAHETQSTDRELPRVLRSLPRNLHPGALVSCFHTDRGETDPFPPQELLWYKGEDARSPASSAPTVRSQPSRLWQTGRHPKGLLYSLLAHRAPRTRQHNRPLPTQTACGSATHLPRLHAHGLPTMHIKTAPSSGPEDGFLKPRVATGRAVDPCPHIPG